MLRVSVGSHSMRTAISQSSYELIILFLRYGRHTSEHADIPHALKLLVRIVRLVVFLVSLDASVLDEMLGGDDCNQT